MSLLARISLALALLSCADAALGAPAPSRLVGNEETMVELGMRVFRGRQDRGERASAIRSVGLAPWRAACPAKGGEVMTGAPEADRARDNMLASTEAALAARGFAVKRLPRPASEPSAEAWREVALLVDAVGKAILDATWNGWFRTKVASFEYRLGNLTALLSEQGVDAVLFVGAACDEASAGYRKFFLPSFPEVVILFSFVDRGGEVLWFEVFALHDAYNLRNRRATDELLRHVLEDVQVVERGTIELLGRAAVRVVVSFLDGNGLRRRAEFCGVLEGERAYYVGYLAPERYYFALDLPVFEEVVRSVRLR